MAKARITMTITLEYDIHPEYYSRIDDTDEKRVAFDIEAYKDMPDMLLSHDDSVITVKGEIV